MYCVTKQGPNTEPPQTMGAAINTLYYDKEHLQILTFLI